jgi:hypothetical protein
LSDGASSAQDSPDVEITGDTITIKNTGTYTLSGTLANGNVKVNAAGDVTLKFNGVHITSNSGSPYKDEDIAAAPVTLSETVTYIQF